MTKLGYLALNKQTGEKLVLSKLNQSPRAQLLDKLSRKHADKMYVDREDGSAKHIGWIVARGWWRIYTISDWEGKTA